MGLYDNIWKENVDCPHCGNKMRLFDKIKWREYDDRTCKVFTEGDNIDLPDGRYNYASSLRPILYSICKECNNIISFHVVILNKRITKIEVDKPQRVVKSCYLVCDNIKKGDKLIK